MVKIRKWGALLLSCILFFQMISISAFGEDIGVEGRRSKYNELKIELGDGQFNEKKDLDIANAILDSPFASEETKSLAQRYKNEVIANRLLLTASWGLPILYRVNAELYARATQPPDDTINALQYSAIAFLILGGAAIVYLEMFQPRIPEQIVQAYNEDLEEHFDLKD
jgi:hypothetical protein